MLYAKGVVKVTLLFLAIPFILIAGNLYLFWQLLRGLYAITPTFFVGSINTRRSGGSE